MTGFRKMKKLLQGRSGMSYMLTVSLVLILLLLLLVMAEFARLSLIAYGVRDALQQAVISVATTNYNEVYDGLREGYSGGYRTDGSSWTANLDYGDVYGNLDHILGLGAQGGYHVKQEGAGYEYRISGLSVSIQNTPFAPGDANRNFEAEAAVTLEIPLSFGWDFLPPIHMTIRTKAAYMPKF